MAKEKDTRTPREKLYATRPTDFGFHGKTTEKAQTGGWGKGPGNNVSDTLRGVNAAHDKMFQAIGPRVNAHFKAMRKAKRAERVARRQAMGLL